MEKISQFVARLFLGQIFLLAGISNQQLRWHARLYGCDGRTGHAITTGDST